MMDTLSFLAEVAPTDCALQFGHDGARVEIWSKPIVADFAQACQMVGYTGKNLHLEFFEPAGRDAVLSFQASIAGINSAIRMTKDRVKIKFDVSQQFKSAAARLAGMTERVYRLEISETGNLPVNGKAKGEFGQFWKRMHDSTMLDCPDLRAVLGCDFESGSATVWEALHSFFGVKSLSFVPPEDASRRFESNNRPGVAAIARRLADNERR